MTLPDALVGRLALHVRSDDRRAPAETLKALERATRQALVTVARTIGDEVLVLRRVPIELSAVSSGPRGFETGSDLSELSAMIEQSLRRQLTRRGTPTEATWVSESLAQYSSEATACAERLIGLVTGTSEQWPRRALAHFGSSITAVLDYAFQRSRVFASTTLAHVVGSAAWLELLASSPLLDQVTHWVEETAGPVDWVPHQLNHGAASRAESATLAPIPPEILSRARSAAHEIIQKLERAPSAPTSATHRMAARRLALLGELLRHWPPARDRRISATELDGLLEVETTEQVLTSRAGGLVFWAPLVEELELPTIYSSLRQRKAIFWALGRTLESASLSPGDPLLALFAGEIPGAILAVGATLRDTDPEPLAVRALQLVPREELNGPFRIVPFGDDAVLMAGNGVVLDSLAQTAPEEAIPDFVKRFRARLNRSPSPLETYGTITDADLEAIAATDSVAVPAPWQHALRTVVSVLLRNARARFGAPPQTLHGWRAVLTDGPTIELRKVDVIGLAEGSWLRTSVRLGGIEHAVVVR